MFSANAWRGASFFMGITAAGLGCWGAWEAAYALHGEVNYLTIAAPVIAVGAALIPPLAEHAWKERLYAKSLLWWLVLIPAVATVFLSAFERTHEANAGKQADRAALTERVNRRALDLADANKALREVAPKEARERARENCGLSCRTILEDVRAKREAVDKAERALVTAQKAVTEEAALKMPSWLLPLSLDLIAFSAIWTALSGPTPSKGEDKGKLRRVKLSAKARKARGEKAAATRKMRQITAKVANGELPNVIPMNKA